MLRCRMQPRPPVAQDARNLERSKSPDARLPGPSRHDRHPPARRVTLTDIADACGLSRATVSLVLRGSPLVHAETRARVEAELKRQGYVYHRGAANLRRKVSSTRRAGHQRPVQPVLRRVRRRRRRGAGRRRLRHPARQHRRIGRAPAGGAGLAARARSGRHHPVAGRRQRWRAPARPARHAHADAGVQSRARRPDWDFLALDNVRGARLATEHLLALGHRRIAFFGGHRDSSSCRQRREGYREALRAAGITPEPQWLVECAPTRLEAARQTGALFVRDPAPTAAVCYNDAVALGPDGRPGRARSPRRPRFRRHRFRRHSRSRGQRAAADDDRRRSARARPPGRRTDPAAPARARAAPSPPPSRPCSCRSARAATAAPLPRERRMKRHDPVQRRTAHRGADHDLLHVGRADQPQRRADPAPEGRVRDELRADDADPVHLLRRLLPDVAAGGRGRVARSATSAAS